MTDRRLELQIEVPGTPEQVWEAIATGEGIAAWFVPTDVTDRVGGTITAYHGGRDGDFDSVGTVTAFEPPHRFAYEEEWQPNDDASAERTATEFIVEAHSGGTCVVRLVSSGFGTGEGWERAIESLTSGWSAFLHNLRLYLTHYAGQERATSMAWGSAPGPVERAWPALSGELGLEHAAVGERVSVESPPLAGKVERISDSILTLLLEEPAPGIAIVAVGGTGAEHVFVQVHLYLFGPDAPAVAARDQPAWRAWMAERFPSEAPVS
jgi:uncharacterized protein YndB with AHSA1/START domain